MIPAETIHGVECPGVHNAPTSERLLFVLAPESNFLKLSREHLVDGGFIEEAGSVENRIDSYLATHAPIMGSCGSTATISPVVAVNEDSSIAVKGTLSKEALCRG